jgi:hypothetical protein
MFRLSNSNNCIEVAGGTSQDVTLRQSICNKSNISQRFSLRCETKLESIV